MPGFNINKQIDHWKKGSIEAFESADILIDKGKILFGLFFCHLAVEKMLKAHYIRCTEKLAPKTHDLEFLSRNTDLGLSPEQTELLDLLLKYQMEGRYPEDRTQPPNVLQANKYLAQTKELIEWLTQKF